jgi:hypothetical protein
MSHQNKDNEKEGIMPSKIFDEEKRQSICTLPLFAPLRTVSLTHTLSLQKLLDELPSCYKRPVHAI